MEQVFDRGKENKREAGAEEDEQNEEEEKRVNKRTRVEAVAESCGEGVSDVATFWGFRDLINSAGTEGVNSVGAIEGTVGEERVQGVHSYSVINYSNQLQSPSVSEAALGSTSQSIYYPSSVQDLLVYANQLVINHPYPIGTQPQIANTYITEPLLDITNQLTVKTAPKGAIKLSQKDLQFREELAKEVKGAIRRFYSSLQRDLPITIDFEISNELASGIPANQTPTAFHRAQAMVERIGSRNYGTVCRLYQNENFVQIWKDFKAVLAEHVGSRDKPTIYDVIDAQYIYLTAVRAVGGTFNINGEFVEQFLSLGQRLCCVAGSNPCKRFILAILPKQILLRLNTGFSFKGRYTSILNPLSLDGSEGVADDSRCAMLERLMGSPGECDNLFGQWWYEDMEKVANVMMGELSRPEQERKTLDEIKIEFGRLNLRNKSWKILTAGDAE